MPSNDLMGANSFPGDFEHSSFLTPLTPVIKQTNLFTFVYGKPREFY